MSSMDEVRQRLAALNNGGTQRQAQGTQASGTLQPVVQPPQPGFQQAPAAVRTAKGVVEG